MDTLLVGEKIRKFRKRAGLTQLELELRIDASSGSISHIEKGDTNPSKETIIKIINALNLSAREAATLFNIEINNELTKLVDISKKFNTLDLKQVINNFANDSVHELNLAHSIMIWIKEGDVLKATPFTKSWYTDLILKLLPIPLSSVYISLLDQKFKGNLIGKAAIDKKVHVGEYLSDFGIGIYNKSFLNKVQKIMGIKVIASVPMMIAGECIGVISPTWDDKTKFENSFPIFQAFANQLAATINNINEYKKLQKELAELKAQRN